jgi:hypothetical protein
MVNDIGYREATTTKPTFVKRMLGVALNLDKLAILDIAKNAAAFVTTRSRPSRCSRYGITILLPRSRHILVRRIVLYVITHPYTLPSFGIPFQVIEQRTRLEDT